MKYRILLTTGACVCLLSVTAQQRSSKAFAITSADKGTFQWTDVKLIDVTTGEVVQSVFDSKQPNAALFSARNGKAIKNDPALQADKNNQALSSMSAACAYDARHNRLYYTPMFVNELRYIDLSARSPKVYVFNAEAFSKSNTLNNEANHITRMTIGADGNGYALSNDGNHLVRFTTGRKPVITDLGAVQDDPANGPISIHAKATSWGGDMVADASGNLYVFTAFQQVFKVNIQTRTATYIAKMKGLPEKYTTNGAAVNDQGKLVVSSANSVDGYYEVDMGSWQASPITTNDKVFNTSDLATGNLAFNNRKEIALMNRETVRDDKIGVYPNPVTTGSFKVTFTTKEFGRYNIQLVDLSGKVVAQRPVTIGMQGQVAEVPVGKGLANGAYLVKVINPAQKAVYTNPVVIAN